MMYYGYGLGMGFGIIWQLLIFAAFFLIVWWLVKNNQFTTKQATDSAEDILKKRLARGEIIRKEYQELKSTISQK